MIGNHQKKEQGKGRRKKMGEGKGERREEVRRGRGGPAASSETEAEEQTSSFREVLGTSSHCPLLLGGLGRAAAT